MMARMNPLRRNHLRSAESTTVGNKSLTMCGELRRFPGKGGTIRGTCRACTNAMLAEINARTQVIVDIDQALDRYSDATVIDRIERILAVAHAEMLVRRTKGIR